MTGFPVFKHTSGYSVLDSFSIVELLIVCSCAYYVVAQLALAVGIRRLPKQTSASKPFVSVVVAARNEEDSIGDLLKILTSQSYPDYEIIVVDDRSTDATSNIVRSFQSSDSRLNLVTIDSKSTVMPAKKNALTRGIQASKGEILCFTDADCLPGTGWIANLVACFEKRVGLVAGFSPYDAGMLPPGSQKGLGKRILLRFIEGEEFKGAMWSAGAIGLNLAWLCTGRNLAYRRSVFEEVGGFEKIKMSVSGDDDLFIQIVRRLTKWNIRYVLSPESQVRTAPPPTFAKFVEQRTRHFSSGKYFTLPMKLFFFFFHISNLILLFGLIASICLPSLVLIAAIAFALKLGADFFLTVTATSIILHKTFWRGFRLSHFLLTEVLYVLYNTLIGPLGFVKTFRWKPDQASVAANSNPVT